MSVRAGLSGTQLASLTKVFTTLLTFTRIVTQLTLVAIHLLLVLLLHATFLLVEGLVVLALSLLIFVSGNAGAAADAVVHLLLVLGVAWVSGQGLRLLSLQGEVVLVAGTVVLLVLNWFLSELGGGEVLLVGAQLVATLSVVLVLIVLVSLLVWLEGASAGVLLRWRDEVGVAVVVLAVHLVLELGLQLGLAGELTRLHHQNLLELVLQLPAS